MRKASSPVLLAAAGAGLAGVVRTFVVGYPVTPASGSPGVFDLAVPVHTVAGTTLFGAVDGWELAEPGPPPTPTPTPEPVAELTLSPNPVHPGDRVNVKGSGFQHCILTTHDGDLPYRITIHWVDGPGVSNGELATTRLKGEDGFAAVFTVPTQSRHLPGRRVRGPQRWR